MEEISKTTFTGCHPGLGSDRQAGDDQWQMRLQEYGQATRKLDEERRKFLLMNRIPKEKTPKMLSPDVENWIKMYQQAWFIFHYQNQVRKLMKDQLEAFGSDNMPLPLGFEKHLLLCDSLTLKIISLSLQTGDQNLRNAALQSLRSYRLEIKHDWPKVAGFVKAEREFSRLNRK